MRIFKKLLYCLVFLFFVFIFSNEVNGAIKCAYEINIPEIFVAIKGNIQSKRELEAKNYTYNNKKVGYYELVEAKCKAGDYEPGQIYDDICRNGELVTNATKIYIEAGAKTGSSWKDYVLNGNGSVTYLGTTAGTSDNSAHNIITITDKDGKKTYYYTQKLLSGLDAKEQQEYPQYVSAARDYMNADMFNEIPITEHLDAWFQNYNGSNCPDLHAYYKEGAIELHGGDMKNYDYYIHKTIVSGDAYRWDWEKKDFSDKPITEDPGDKTSPNVICDYNLKGLGDLDGKNVDLKLQIKYGDYEGGRDYYDVTFISGDNKKTFSDVYNDKLEYYDLGFDVKNLEANPKIFISESIEDGFRIDNFVSAGRCSEVTDLYIFPYVYKDSKDNGIMVYKITTEKREYTPPPVDQLKTTVRNFEFCTEDGVLKAFRIVGYMLILIKILVPLLLIIFGVIDYSKAVIASDDKAINKATQTLVIRVVAGIIIFFIPSIINAVTNLISKWSDVESNFTKCSTCLFKTSDCDNKFLENVCTSKPSINYNDGTTMCTHTWDSKNQKCVCKEK